MPGCTTWCDAPAAAAAAMHPAAAHAASRPEPPLLLSLDCTLPIGPCRAMKPSEKNLTRQFGSSCSGKCTGGRGATCGAVCMCGEGYRAAEKCRVRLHNEGCTARGSRRAPKQVLADWLHRLGQPAVVQGGAGVLALQPQRPRID